MLLSMCPAQKSVEENMMLESKHIYLYARMSSKGKFCVVYDMPGYAAMLQRSVYEGFAITNI